MKEGEKREKTGAKQGGNIGLYKGQNCPESGGPFFS
jgi:hypothetical protein